MKPVSLPFKLEIELFYQSLVQNRKNASNPSQQIYVNNEQTQAYFL